jgi:hypothetical protein
MVDAIPSTAPVAPFAATSAVPLVSLSDWCRQKSKTVGKQVEMLSAFHFMQKRANKTRDTAANFEQAFNDFANAPVEEPPPPKARHVRKSK